MIDIPWIEKYRPDKIENIISQKNIKTMLSKYLTKKNIPHFLLYGPPGTGKTSSILALAKELYGSNYKNMILELNASDDRNIKVVREVIKEFAKTQSNFSLFYNSQKSDISYKLVILDEIDSMTQDAQFCLRRIIETYSKNTRFCLICNYISKIIPALQSRCCKFHFNLLQETEIREKLIEICDNENVSYDIEGLNEIISLSNGDMRRCINILQFISIAYETVNINNVCLVTGNISKHNIKIMLNQLFTLSLNDSITFINQKRIEGLSISDLTERLAIELININIDPHLLSEALLALARLEHGINVTTEKDINSGELASIFVKLREGLICGE